MNIRAKLLLLGGTGIVPVVAVALAGWEAIVNFDAATRNIVNSSIALGNHWEGDMMHEGLRADVFAALTDQTDEQKAKSRKVVEEDANRFREAVGRNRKLKLDAEITAGLNELAPRLEAYIAEGTAIVNLAGHNRAAALERVPRFQEAFELLDGAQEKVADLIVKREEKAAKDAERLAESRKHFMAGICTLALVGLAAAAWLMALSIARPLSAGLQCISEGSHQVAVAAAQISSASQTLAQAANEQAASLQETTASAEQVGATTLENAGNSALAESTTRETVQEMVRANDALSGMVESMDEIVDSASKIEKIIQAIDGIAFQTNILALNAAVEAARAGEAGMGFAVVADEVRTLAHRSAEAARNTAELIQEAIKRSQTGKSKLDYVSSLMLSVREKADRISRLSEGVNAGCAEQSKGVEAIAKGVSELQTVTQQIAANAEEHAAAAEELTAEAASLDSAIAGMTSLVGSVSSISQG